MSKNIKFWMLFIATIAVVSFTVISVNAQAMLTDESKVVINGIGTIRVGMTVAEASQSSGIKLIQQSSGGEEYGCLIFKPQNEPKGISFMVTENRIARVEIWENRRISTLKGARIGDTEAKIKSLYPGQIRVTQHEYVQRGHYLTFVPKDAADRNYRIVFETDGNRVTNFRSGKLPEVEYIEGCV